MLESQIAETEMGLEHWTKAMGIPRLFLVEAEYVAAMNRAELEWVRNLIRDIQGGTLWITHDEMKAVDARLGNREEGGEKE
jgi:hypothetical protein